MQRYYVEEIIDLIVEADKCIEENLKTLKFYRRFHDFIESNSYKLNLYKLILTTKKLIETRNELVTYIF